MGTPPPALCARRSYTPIHCVRHWTVDPQPPCHLAGRGRRPLIGPSSADEPVWAVQTNPVRTAGRSLSCGCATTLAWITTWSAGKHCAMAPPTRMLLHVAHIHAVRAHSSGANGFPRGPPISFSESTARSLRTAALFPFQCTSHGENRAMEPTCWVLSRSCPRLGRGGLPLVLQRPFGFPPRRRFRAGRLASALCTPLHGPIQGHICVGDHRLLWSMGSATRARLRYPLGGERLTRRLRQIRRSLCSVKRD